MYRQADPHSPTWFDGTLQKNHLEDEISFVQYGQQNDDIFYHYHLNEGRPSSWNEFPTAQSKSTKFKYASIEWNYDHNLFHWQRQTYSLLDWLGDLGGLFDALWYVVSLIVRPASAFVLQTILLTFFRIQDRKQAKKDENATQAQESEKK